ncbi:hypothetical protein RRG08_014729 [Elysia crispata]|uniref:Uncharacterized protein n=1 Tax=Elysia crispata TaxID=231223 RepID=A0AAE1ATX2_9GAST|nr:hypothetical protein RRG08_014729 [Elysia crispata]
MSRKDKLLYLKSVVSVDAEGLDEVLATKLSATIQSRAKLRSRLTLMLLTASCPALTMLCVSSADLCCQLESFDVIPRGTSTIVLKEKVFSFIYRRRGMGKKGRCQEFSICLEEKPESSSPLRARSETIAVSVRETTALGTLHELPGYPGALTKRPEAGSAEQASKYWPDSLTGPGHGRECESLGEARPWAGDLVLMERHAPSVSKEGPPSLARWVRCPHGETRAICLQGGSTLISKMGKMSTARPPEARPDYRFLQVSVHYHRQPVAHDILQDVCSALLIQCSSLLTQCSSLLTQCSALLTQCSSLLTQCSALLTQCSSLLTQCSSLLTQCSSLLTQCSSLLTQCSSLLTQCSALLTQCSSLLTQRSALLTQCSSLLTQCSALLTQCSSLLTQCSSLLTQCSSLLTQCSSLLTQCSALLTQCSSLLTQCSALLTQCSSLLTQCSALLTQCSSLLTSPDIFSETSDYICSLTAQRNTQNHLH